MSDQFGDKLVTVLRRHLPLAGNQPFPMETDLEDLGLESMNAILMLLDLEEVFGIVLPDSMLTEDTFRSGATLERALRTLTSPST